MPRGKKERRPENGELEATELRLVVLHPAEPRIGSNPMRTVLDALQGEPDTIIVQNVAATSPVDFEVPTRLRQP